jgi:8-oxo-dGTP pyrophosphatase MutT (NUDIX family)
MRYVVGFMFDESMGSVALLRKNKPEWQAGLLNGIGGKIEGEEPAVKAMVREFNEEAGILTFVGTWVNFCSMSGINNDGGSFGIEFFYTIGNPRLLTSMESEKIEVLPSADVAAGKEKTIGNLPWLIALALDFGKGVFPPSKIVAFYGKDAK